MYGLWRREVPRHRRLANGAAQCKRPPRSCGVASLERCRGGLFCVASPAPTSPPAHRLGIPLPARGPCTHFSTGCSAQWSASTRGGGSDGGPATGVASPQTVPDTLSSTGVPVTSHRPLVGAETTAGGGGTTSTEDATTHSGDGGVAHETNCRMSPLHIQMLSKSLHRHIFGGTEPNLPEATVRKARQHLAAHSVGGSGGSLLPEVDLRLPPLQGNDIDEHFQNIAKSQSRVYLEHATRLTRCELHPTPKEWQLVEGWTCYETGKSPVGVAYPEEDALVLDVEVCVREGPLPILATAASTKCWYGWVSRRLASSHEDHCTDQAGAGLDELIPLETSRGRVVPAGGAGAWREKLVVGHNVSYDRARIKEQYLMKVDFYPTPFQFSNHFCTLRAL